MDEEAFGDDFYLVKEASKRTPKVLVY